MNTTEQWTIIGLIRNDELRKLLKPVFSVGIMPITSTEPEHKDLPDMPATEIYRLDVGAMTIQQRERFAVVMAAKSGVALDEVRSGMDKYVLIRADDLSVYAVEGA